ncbi:MAG: 3-oxoacyl-ACP synthase III family protein [Gemmataceae bacterium]
MTVSRPLPRPKCKTLMGVRIVGTGKYLPDLVVTNNDLFDKLNFAARGYNAEWIQQRTGILERRHAPAEMATSDLCVAAANDCFAKTGYGPADIDLVVVGTFTPDMSFPSTACIVQEKLGIVGAAVEVEAACAGFMYALITAAAYVASGASDKALVIGGDANSRILNPGDPKIYPLFGDGAGAVIVERGTPDQGIVSFSLGSDGSGGALLCRPAGGSRTPPSHENLDAGQQYMLMDGQGVYRWAVEILRDTVEDVVSHAGITLEDIALIVPHQANIRIIEQALHKWLSYPRERVFNNLDRYGNTSAASIPIALDEALAADKLQRGQLALFSGFGAGLAWGTAIVRW